MRARSTGVCRGCCVDVIYRCDPCCSTVAVAAAVRLRIKLKNQRELTQMAYRGGENGGGLLVAKEGGINVDAFGLLNI